MWVYLHVDPIYCRPVEGYLERYMPKGKVLDNADFATCTSPLWSHVVTMDITP